MPWRGYPSSPEYGKPEWKRARAACLKRARWRCEIKLEGCQGAASEADHTYGLANDPYHQHLRAACTSCHAKVTAQQGHDARRGARRDPEPSSRIIWDE